MSKASNLAGFVTSISPPSNLNVGVVTASSFFGNGSNLVGIGITSGGSVNTSGIITASSYSVSGTTVIDSSRNLTNIATFDSTVTSLWDQITTTSTSKTLVNREYCVVTSAGIAVTLPASPSSGWEVAVSVGDFTNTVIGRNSQNIMGLAEDMTINIVNSTVNLVYIDATRGWRIS